MNDIQSKIDVENDDIKDTLEKLAYNTNDFSKLRLNGIQVENIVLHCMNFKDSSFVNANFAHSFLTGCNFTNAKLNHAYLEFSDLEDAKLTNANLSFSHLKCTNLSYSNLEGAILTGADCTNTNFYKCNLKGISPSWNSHNLISAILFQCATNIEQEMLAAFIGKKKDWCWDRWVQFEHSEKKWAIKVLRKYADNDFYCPSHIKAIFKKYFLKFLK